MGVYQSHTHMFYAVLRWRKQTRRKRKFREKCQDPKENRSETWLRPSYHETEKTRAEKEYGYITLNREEDERPEDVFFLASNETNNITRNKYGHATLQEEDANLTSDCIPNFRISGQDVK